MVGIEFSNSIQFYLISVRFCIQFCPIRILLPVRFKILIGHTHFYKDFSKHYSKQKHEKFRLCSATHHILKNQVTQQRMTRNHYPLKRS